MSSIVGACLRLRFLVVALAAVVMLLGFTQLRGAPADILPEFAPPYVEIQTESLGLSAEEVEQLITVPIEQDLLIGVPWLDTIRSESVPGLSSIVLTFQPGTDLMRARQMVAERMTQASALPHVSKPPTMIQPLSSTSRVMMVGLSSKSVSMIQMGVLARWTVAPRLLGIPGVANVAVWGQRDRQLQVLVDPERLRAQGISLTSVLETTGNALWVSSLSFVEASTPGTGGFIDTPNQRLGILHISPIASAEGLAEIPVLDRKKSDGTPLRLSDVASVVEDHQPLIGDAVVNEDPSLLLVIEKFPGSNTMEVTRGVEAALDEMRPGLPGITVNTTIYRPATFVETALGNLILAFILGCILIVLVLGVLHWNWHVALISLVTIPLSLIAAGLVLYLRGETINVMVLAGFTIAIGVVIDDAIVDVENIVRRLRENRRKKNPKPVATVVVEASSEVRGAITYATLIIIITALPVLFMGGLTGRFFHPLAVSYALAVLASLLVAVTVTPALCLMLLGNAAIERHESPLLRWLQRGYGTALSRIIRQPRLALTAVICVFLAGVAVFPFLGQSLLPNFRERDLRVHLDAAPATSEPEMSRIVALLSRELQSIPGIRDVGAQIGRAVMGDQVVGINSADLWANVDPSADYDRTVTDIKEVVSGYPGLQGDVQTYLKERSGAIVPGTSDPLVVRVYGPELNALRLAAEQVKEAMAGIGGVVDPHVTLPVEEPSLEIEVNIAAAQRYGLKPGDVRRAGATLLSGLQVGSIFEEQKVFDVVVWSTPETRYSLDGIRNLLIDTPSGDRVRLGDVADVRIVPTPTVIKHEAVSRYLDVGAGVHGRDLESVAGDVKARLRQLQFPLEYHAEVLGEYAERQAVQNRLLTFVAAALIGILLLLQAVFGSWRLALATFLTLPSALVGGLLATYFTDAVVSLGSLAGLLLVFGIATRNSIMMISHYQHLERQEGEIFDAGIALRGAMEKLSPVLMTALATALALVPVLFLGDVPGLEIVRPMAIVVLGGLITSTLLNLFIVPPLYLRLVASRRHDIELAQAA